MSLFIPITKVDVAQRLVYGTISEEVPDKTGEIMDYESSKPAFEAWSGQFHAASGGKSLGNIRAMHGSVAAGKLTDIHYNDAQKRIEGVAKIVDEDEWQKVCEGVYTGFSIGGGYARRWPDETIPGLMRYTPVLSEVSLVDNPAVPTATFQFIKNDGSVELRKFEHHRPVLKGKHSAVAAIPAISDAAIQTRQLEEGLAWLGQHANAIGAKGLLRHVVALQSYLQEQDETDGAAKTDIGKALLLPAEEKPDVEALKKRIAELERAPMPAKGQLRIVGKHEDYKVVLDGLNEREAPDSLNALMKKALSQPMPM